MSEATLGLELRQALNDAQKAARVGFASRVAAIESLEVHALDRLRYLEEGQALPADVTALREQSSVLVAQLGEANERVVRRLQQRIRTGRYSLKGLVRAFAACGTAAPDGDYDALDQLVSGLLAAGVPGEEQMAREPEMVAYQPTPARAILALLERAQITSDDVFYDLGSGLGRVTIMVGLLSGARARGVELEPAYCSYASRSARLLGLPGIDFLQFDAREAPLAEGTVYFMFTPFRGAMLRSVLVRLQAEARQRPIRVCTYGPCTAEVARASWLKPDPAHAWSEHEVAVFRSYGP